MNTADALQFAFADAHDALVIAQKDGRWADVAKYAGQLAKIQGEIEHAARMANRYSQMA